jgi:4-hydroxy-3-polyprenylbenzoate decarboxylase
MRIFVGITGSSGVIYGGRLLRALERPDLDVTTCISDGAVDVMRAEELSATGGMDRAGVIKGFGERHGLTRSLERLVEPGDMANEFASGSAMADAAVVCPCSMSSLASVANGITRNLIHRVADVMLKESRPLALVPRETPLSEIHLRNMLAARRAGALLIPAMPAYYHHPRTIEDLADFVAGKVLDSIGVSHELFRRWQGTG